MSGLEVLAAAAAAPLEPAVPAQLTPLVRRVLCANPSMMTGPGTNTYLVGRGDTVTCIDPGPVDEAHLAAILGALDAAGDRLATILCTHTHPDHSPGAVALAERTGAVVKGYGPMERPAIEKHASLEGSEDTFRADHPLRDGDVHEGADHRLVAVHTPGHASNHLCFLLEEPAVPAGPLLFTGDHVMSGSTVVIAPLDGDMAVYLQQLERLLGLGLAAIVPGHGPVITTPDDEVRRLLAHRAAREAKVAAAVADLGEEVVTLDPLLLTVYGDVEEKLRPVALYSLWAAMRKLAGEGRASSDDPDRIDASWAGTATFPVEGLEAPCPTPTSTTDTT